LAVAAVVVVKVAVAAVAAAVANRIGLKFKNLFLATLPNL
jgi:hypothetical protein